LSFYTYALRKKEKKEIQMEKIERKIDGKERKKDRWKR
jgi:hypothetical protein